MLKGTTIALRPIRESDLAELYDFHVEVDNRGDYFPRGIASEVTFTRQFQETGAASRRVADKCGFRHEGTARGAWYNNGRYQDVEIYAIVQDDVIGSG
jgi:hypothetical protein